MLAERNKPFVRLVCAAVILGLLLPVGYASGGWLCTLLRICRYRGAGGDGLPRSPAAVRPLGPGWVGRGTTAADLADIPLLERGPMAVGGPVVAPGDFDAEGTALTPADFVRIAALAEEGWFEEAAREAEARSDDPVAGLMAARLRLMKPGISADEVNQQIGKLIDIAGRMRNHNMAASAALTAASEAEKVGNPGAAVAALELAMQRLKAVPAYAMGPAERMAAGGLFTEVMRGWVRLGPWALQQPCQTWQRVVEARDSATDALMSVTCPPFERGPCDALRERRKDLLKVELALARGEHGWPAHPRRAAEVEAALLDLGPE